MQTPDIPSQISHAQLNEFLSSASKEGDAPDKESFEAYRDRICQQADSIIEYSTNIPDLDPMVHKILVLKLLCGFGNYLKDLSTEASSSDEADAFKMDIGQIYAAHKLIMGVNIHEGDFTHPEFEEPQE